MGGGRKNLKRGVDDKNVILQQGQTIMQVVSLRGSNLIEVMDAKGETSLAMFPAKFQKSLWIKRGNFVVVDESGKVEALESGSKVGCIVSQVLFHDQVRQLQKRAEWPEAFKSQPIVSSSGDLPGPASEQEETGTSEDDDDDEGLPPLESNTNRIRPYDLHADSASHSESDTDTDGHLQNS